MYKIPSKLEEFVKDAKELEEEIAVDIVSRGDDLFVVAMDEDKRVKYEEFSESMERESLWRLWNLGDLFMQFLKAMEE